MDATAYPVSPDRTRLAWGAVLLIVVALAQFLPGFASLPPMDRDEPRFAQASKQMLESGDFVAIRFQDEARNKKPVGIYWMQAAAVAAGEFVGLEDARRSIWLYRLPSLIGAIGVVLGTYWVALALTTPRAAFAASLLIASSVLLTVEAHLAKTDAMLCATVVVAMGALARIYLGSPRVGALTEVPRLRLQAVFWSAVAVGVLIKGPITPMVPAFAVTALCCKDRSLALLRALRPGLGLAWVLLLVLPWFVLILVRTKGVFLADSLGHDMLGKVAGARESHGAPPGSYLAAFWVSAWPMTPFAALALPAIWRRRSESRVAFLLAWIIPTWLLFELVPTKLPHYVLPTYPAIAVLAAALLEHEWRRKQPRSLAQSAVAAGLVGLMPIGLAIVLYGGQGFLWDSLPTGTAIVGIGVAIGLLALALWVGRSVFRRDLQTTVLATTASALLAYTFILGHLLAPAVANRIDLSARLAEAGRRALGGCVQPRMASAGDHEPSLVLLTDTDLLLTDGGGAADFLRGGDCRMAFVTDPAKAPFMAAAADIPDLHLAERVSGTAINGARRLDIDIYVRQRQGP